eukprot:436993_1
MSTFLTFIVLMQHSWLILSNPNCKYLHFSMAIDVCSEYYFWDQDLEIKRKGSYQYKCSHDYVVVHFWTDSENCDGESGWYSDPYYTDNKQCHGSICDYVTLRIYETSVPKPNKTNL